MSLRFLKIVLPAFAILMVASVAQAQNAESQEGHGSVFSNPGQGGRWIDQFFPYGNPNLSGIHAAVGKMLEVYNSGILVLATMLALWAIVTFVVDTAHHGTFGGKRHSALYGPIRLVVAMALLVPMASGYNGAQIIALKLADGGSGLANSIWKKFSPASTSLNFSRSSFAAGNIDAFLQQAMINEACFAATQLDSGQGGPAGSVSIQAFYSASSRGGEETEGAEMPLTSNGSNAGIDSMMSYGAIATEARMIGRVASGIRIHYNRIGNDDYCGSLDLPVPNVPDQSQLQPEDQMAYATAYLKIRPDLATYAQKVASAIDAAVKAHSAPQPIAAPESPGESQAFIPNAGEGAPLAQPSAQKPVSQIEVPYIELPVSAWDALIGKFNAVLLDATDTMQQRYITTEVERDYGESSDDDWVWAGSLFFKLTKLSHDDLKLRYGIVSAGLPNSDILPAEMRTDGALSSCPDLRSDVFLPDYHCRPDGKETTLVIKTAYDIVHTVESQRSGNALPAIDAGPTANHKGDVLSGNLIAAGRLDAVIAQLAQGVETNNPNTQNPNAKPDERFESMFDAVNIGNALYLSSTSLFREAALAGSAGNNGVSSAVLSLFAVMVLVPAFFLAVYLPLLPALRFFLGMTAWFVTIFEALVALPLIAMVQLKTEGEGILSHGRQGWFLLLQMLLRPALMIFGLMAGIIIFEALYSFITWAIWSGLLHMTGDANQFGTGIEGMLELLGYLFFWSLLVYFAANLSFNAITQIPDRILIWIGAANVGTSAAVSGSSGSSEQAAGATAIIGGGPQGPILPSAPAATMVTGSSINQSVQQIGQFGGAAGSYNTGYSGHMASGGDSANFEHFPTPNENDPPDAPPPSVNTTISNNPNGPRSIPGRPQPIPREAGDYVPPVKGGDK